MYFQSAVSWSLGKDYLQRIECNSQSKDIGHDPILRKCIISIHHNPKTTIQNMRRRKIKRPNLYPINPAKHNQRKGGVKGTFPLLLNHNMIPMNRLAQSSSHTFIPRRTNLQSTLVHFSGGKYIRHCKNPNDAKIRGEEVIQVVFVEVFEQYIQPDKHNTPADGKHPCIVRGDHIHRWLIVFIGGTFRGSVSYDFRFERRRDGMLER